MDVMGDCTIDGIFFLSQLRYPKRDEEALVSINPVQTVRLYLFNSLWIVYCLTFSIAREARCYCVLEMRQKSPLISTSYRENKYNIRFNYLKHVNGAMISYFRLTGRIIAKHKNNLETSILKLHLTPAKMKFIYL